LKEINLIYKKFDDLLISLEKESKLKMESPLFCDFLFNKFSSSSGYKFKNSKITDIRELGKRLLKIKENKVTRNLIIPGNMYYFEYIPKGIQKLSFWDRNPCVLCLGKFKNGFYGLNLNLLDPVKKHLLVKALPFVSNQSRYEELVKMEKSFSLNEDHEFYPYRTYFGYKRAKTYFKKEHKVIFRKYLYSRIPSFPSPGHIPFKYFKIMSVMELFDFWPEQSQFGVWLETRRKILKNSRK
jgi:hypothetical protein